MIKSQSRKGHERVNKKVVYYHELRKFIKSKKMTFKRYAHEVLHILPMTLTHKFAGRIGFTMDDIINTKNYFNLSPSQVDSFFFHEHIK